MSPGPGVAAYQFMLEQNLGRTMLQFQVSSMQSLYCNPLYCSSRSVAVHCAAVCSHLILSPCAKIHNHTSTLQCKTAA